MMNTALRRGVSVMTNRAVGPSCSSTAVSRHHVVCGRRSYHTSSPLSALPQMHGTTIVCVRKKGKVCMMGDGMVSMGNITVKPNARKIRVITSKSASDGDSSGSSDGTTTLVGFAGSTADAFTLLERLEGKLDEYPGQLARSSVELAKGWRTDKYLRRLEASLIVADSKISLELTGNGDVLESHDGILGIGSGSPYAIAAARALMDIEELSAEDVATKAMKIAAEMCVYTNDNFLVETLDATEEPEEETKDGGEENKGDDDDNKKEE